MPPGIRPGPVHGQRRHLHVVLGVLLQPGESVGPAAGVGDHSLGPPTAAARLRSVADLVAG